MRRIVSNGYTDHLVISNQSPEAVALVEAILDADQAVRREDASVEDISNCAAAFWAAEAAWSRACVGEESTFIGCLIAIKARQITERLRHASA